MGAETDNIFIMTKSIRLVENLIHFDTYSIILHVIMKHLWWFQVCSAQVSKYYAD